MNYCLGDTLIKRGIIMALIYIDTSEYIITTNYAKAVQDYGDMFEIETPQEVANIFLRPVYDEGECKTYFAELNNKE